MDLPTIILEEIALEGLDGITIQGLFERLRTRPGFNLLVDEDTKPFLWNITRKLCDIQGFFLSQPRPPLLVYDRREFVDERGNVFEPAFLTEDIYEYNPIQDVEANLRGSCKEYKTRRQCVIHNLSCAAASRNENQLVLVASQSIREKMFLPEAQDVESSDLSLIQYCMLERIARARYQGELTRGKVSMSCMKIEPKSLFYQRKFLLKKGLITKQAYSMKFSEAVGNTYVNIFHIPRFFNEFESTCKKSIRGMIELLASMPNRECPSVTLRNNFGKNNLRTFLGKEYSAIVEQVDREGNNTSASGNLKQYLNNTFKAVRLLHPGITAENFSQFLEDPTDESRDIEETGRIILPTLEVHSQTSLLYDVLSEIMESKSVGVTIPGIADKFNISQLDARSAVRQIQTYKNALVTSLHDKKKTKIQRFIFYKFKNANKILVNAQPSLMESVSPVLTESGANSILPDIDPASEEPAIYFNTEKITISNHAFSSLPIKPAVQELIDDTKLNGLVEREIHTNGTLFVIQSAKDAQLPPQTINLHDTFSYETSRGWKATINEIKSTQSGTLLRYPSTGTLLYSQKSIERLNMIVSFVYESTIVIGYAGFKSYLRCATDKSETNGMDRKTLNRLLGQLLDHNIIKIFKISLQKEDIIRSVHVFVPALDTVNSSCSLINSTVESLIQTIQKRFKLTRQESMLRRKKKNLISNSILKVPKRKSNKVKSIVLQTTEKAKRGRKKNENKIVKIATHQKVSKALRARVGYSKKYKNYKDDIDKRALGMMTRQRVLWDNEEDCYILCLFLASILFTPKYDQSKIFVFNASQIRNILHSVRPASESKTSLAIRRRIHFLMRNPNFLSRYRYYLSESLQDKTLSDVYLQQHLSQLGLTEKMYPEIPDNLLKDVFFYILNKFNKSSMFKCTTLPSEGSNFQGGFEGQSLITNSLQLIREYNQKIIVVDGRQGLQDKLSVSIWTARSSLMSLIFSGDDIVHVQSLLDNIQDDVLNFTITHLRNLGITTFQKKTHRFSSSQIMKRKFQVYLAPQKFRDSRNLLSQFEKCGSQGHLDCSHQMSTGAVALLTEILTCGSIDFDIKLANPLYIIHEEWKEIFDTMPEDEDDDSGDEDESSTKPPTKKQKLEQPVDEGNDPRLTRLLRISNRAMQLMRSRMHTMNPSAALDKNFFSVNLPQVRARLLPDFYRLNFFVMLDLCTLEQRLVKVVPILCSTPEEKLAAQILTSKRRLGKYLVLYQYINAAKEVGLSLIYLKTKFTRDTLTNGLKYLLENNSIFLVGTTLRKFVSVEYVQPWTMPLPKGKSFITQRVIMRPWLQCSGEVNWNMLDYSFTAIIGHMNLYPDISVEYLCSKLQPVLSPVETMILLEILFEMSMFGFYTLLDQPEEDSLSSKPSVVTKEYIQDPFLDMENLDIELFPLIITKYSLFQHAFHQSELVDSEVFVENLGNEDSSAQQV